MENQIYKTEQGYSIKPGRRGIYINSDMIDDYVNAMNFTKLGLSQTIKVAIKEYVDNNNINLKSNLDEIQIEKEGLVYKFNGKKICEFDNYKAYITSKDNIVVEDIEKQDFDIYEMHNVNNVKPNQLKKKILDYINQNINEIRIDI